MENHQLITFMNEGLGASIRAFSMDGEPTFVAIDVAQALGYANPSRSVQTHCKSLKILKTTDLVVLGVENPPSRGLGVIPESDLYRLILRSNLESAVRFQDWVTEDVLPSIRKIGSYTAPALSTPEIGAVREAIRISNRNTRGLTDVSKRLGVCEAKDDYLYHELQRISSRLLDIEDRQILPAPSPIAVEVNHPSHDAIEDIYHELRVLKAAFSSIQSNAQEALEKIDNHLDSRHGNYSY